MTQNKAHPSPAVAVPSGELKSCPFCGNAAEFKPYKRDGLTLQCKTLGCVTFNQRVMRYSLEWLEEKMIESWNTRATPPSLPAAQAVEGVEAVVEASSILVRFAMGMAHHVNLGLCPDEVAGFTSRDPDCRVCAAIDRALAGGAAK